MYFEMSWMITIGNYGLTMLDSVEITRSVEKLSDTAIIVLPGSSFNKAIEIESQIFRGNMVTIKLGYDNSLTTEFEGYLDRISTDDGSITLHCEDSIFNLKKAIPDKELKNPDVTDILKYILTGSKITLECDYSFKYDKYIIKGDTAYQVLKKIQEEIKANIYLKGNVLHVHPQYSQIFGDAVYSFQDNIESSDLEYRKAEDRLFEVTVEGKAKDGKVIRETVGKKGGDSVTIKIDGVSDKATLRNLANEQLKVKSYTGYSGSLTGWLIPYCDAGYKVYLTDLDYEYKTGAYYVLEVVVKFGASGASRIVKIGKKL